jgi:hypothetical protein
MRRFLTLFVLFPIAVVVVVLSVANRGSVTFSLDPIGAGSTGWAATGRSTSSCSPRWRSAS